MMEWGSSTTSAHSQNSPNNANNIVQQTHSPSINQIQSITPMVRQRIRSEEK